MRPVGSKCLQLLLALLTEGQAGFSASSLDLICQVPGMSMVTKEEKAAFPLRGRVTRVNSNRFQCFP